VKDASDSVPRTIPVGPQLNRCAADVPRLSRRLGWDSERPMGSRGSVCRRAGEHPERVAVRRQSSNRVRWGMISSDCIRTKLQILVLTRFHSREPVCEAGFTSLEKRPKVQFRGSPSSGPESPLRIQAKVAENCSDVMDCRFISARPRFHNSKV